MWVDLILGAPVVNLLVDLKPYAVENGSVAHMSPLHLLDGPVYDGVGTFSAATPFGEDTSEGPPLTQLTGQVVDQDTLRVTVVNPKFGLLGPVQAKRIQGAEDAGETALVRNCSAAAAPAKPATRRR
jgi:hypothetical protein